MFCKEQSPCVLRWGQNFVLLIPNYLVNLLHNMCSASSGHQMVVDLAGSLNSTKEPALKQAS